MKSICLPALVFVGALSLAPAFAAEPITGRASVIDGDTLDIGGTHIRLHGIDAPESAQLCQDRAGKAFQCGQAAALVLADRIGSAPVSCDPRDTDKYGACRKRSTAEIIFSEQDVTMPIHRLMTRFVEADEAL